MPKIACVGFFGVLSVAIHFQPANDHFVKLLRPATHKLANQTKSISSSSAHTIKLFRAQDYSAQICLSLHSIPAVTTWGTHRRQC